MARRITIFVGERNGVLEPSNAGRTITVARERVMQSGEFTVHDKWEKAERHGWRIVECELKPVSIVQSRSVPYPEAMPDE